MKRLLTLPIAGTVIIALAGSVDARIRCNKDYQIVQGNEIFTPYCADNYLAKVAREYGIRVSNSQIRNNPNKKAEVCRLIRHDIRVQDNCPNDSPRGRRY